MEECFATYNRLVKKANPNIGTFGLLLRACSIIENDEVAEELYGFAMRAFQGAKATSSGSTNIGMQFHNAMLDCYAETRNPLAFSFFDYLRRSKKKLDGMTFNSLAKAIIFRDERHQLIEMTEIMKVEGVLQIELSRPVRQEIYEAHQKHLNIVREREDRYSTGRDRADFMKPTLMNRLTGDLDEDNGKAWGSFYDLTQFEFLKFMRGEMIENSLDLNDILKTTPDKHLQTAGLVEERVPDAKMLHIPFPIEIDLFSRKLVNAAKMEPADDLEAPDPSEMQELKEVARKHLPGQNSENTQNGIDNNLASERLADVVHDEFDDFDDDGEQSVDEGDDNDAEN